MKLVEAAEIVVSLLYEWGATGAGRVTVKAPAGSRKKAEAEKAPQPAASQWRMAEDEGRQRLSTSGQARSPTAGHHRFSGVRLNFAEASSNLKNSTLHLRISEQQVRMMPSVP